VDFVGLLNSVVPEAAPWVTLTAIPGESQGVQLMRRADGKLGVCAAEHMLAGSTARDI